MALAVACGATACAVDSGDERAGDEASSALGTALPGPSPRQAFATCPGSREVPRDYLALTFDATCRDRSAGSVSVADLGTWVGAPVQGRKDYCRYSWRGAAAPVAGDVDVLRRAVPAFASAGRAPLLADCSARSCGGGNACAGDVRDTRPGRVTIPNDTELLARCPKCGVVEDSTLYAVLPAEAVAAGSVVARIGLSGDEGYHVTFAPQGSQIIAIDLTAADMPESLASVRDGTLVSFTFRPAGGN